MQPQQQAPAYLVNRAGRGLALQASQGISAAQPPRISIGGNRFTLIDGAGNSRPHTINLINPQTGQLQAYLSETLDVVIIGVNANVSKVFYDTSYDPAAEEKPPTCWSDNGTGPSVSASEPQANTCASCPHNEWGSAINANGKKVKACNDAKKIAVIIPGDPMVYQLRIPPATLKALKKHADTIGGYSLQGPDGRSRGADLCDVVTRVKFESQGVLGFEATSFIDETIGTQIDMVTQDKLDTILGTNDRPISTLPAPAQPMQVTHQPQQYVPPAQPQQFAPPAQQHTPTHVGPAPGQAYPQQPPAPQPGPATPFVMAPPAIPPGHQPPPNGPVPAQATTKRGRGRPAATAAAPQAQPAQATVVAGPPAMMVPPAGPQPSYAPTHSNSGPPAQQWVPPTHAAPPGAPAQPTNFGMASAPGVPDKATQDAVLAAMNFKPQG